MHRYGLALLRSATTATVSGAIIPGPMVRAQICRCWNSNAARRFTVSLEPRATHVKRAL